jgi:DNA helicase-2/ATP-dependent DNA helicase PcrA
MDEILDKLNEEQIKPVKETEGAVLVLAGAGSGKTRVLTSRIAYILREGLAMPSQILAITFTNKAAGEMKERISAFCEVNRSMWICTIHSMCVRILRQFPTQAGIKDNFSIYSETERSNVIKKAYKELDYDDEKLLKSAKFHIGNAKMLGLDPDQYGRENAGEPQMDDIVLIYEKYNQHLRENNALDFDDLLLYTLRVLRGNEEVRDYLSEKFKYILVDEFQDTNTVQYNIIRLLAYKHGNLFAVGDDDQSIYGWRGAQIENILKFDKDYPSAKVFKLERNYRSTGNILHLANTIIAGNGTRHKKTLWTSEAEGDKPVYFQADEESGEALFAARTITTAIANGATYADFAVLMRINALTRSYEQEFTKYGIPYKVFGGFKFYERKEIKDALAYLRILSNPFDNEALERIINVPKRGIGTRTIELMNEYATTNGLSLYDACLDIDDLPVTSGAKSKIEDFTSLVKNLLISAQTDGVNVLVRNMINMANLRSAYDDGTDEGDSKLANLDEFISSVDDFCRLNPESTLDEYLNTITLYSDTDEMDDSNYVTLATIHAVKGLEFKQVFICGLEDGIFPSSRAEGDTKSMEEERRLMYVAITRAEKELYLTRSKSRYLYGHREITRTSRFIRELSTDLGIQEEHRSSYGAYGAGFGEGYGEKSYAQFANNYGNNGYGNNGYNNGGGYSNGYGNSGYGNGGGSKFGKTGYTYGGPYRQSSSQKSDLEDFGYSADSTGYANGYSSNNGYSSGSGYSSSYGNRTGASKGTQAGQSEKYKTTFGGVGSSGFGVGGMGGFGSKKSTAPAYSVGMRVQHVKFGEGTIIAIKNNGTVLNVAFNGQGIKELSAAIAPLTILK